MFKKAVVFKNVHTVSVMKHKLLTENCKKNVNTYFTIQITILYA